MSVPKREAGKRKRMRPDERRQQVLSIAAKVFAEKGYRMAAVTDIVEGAGIGRGTFYLYFSSKRDVFLELIESYFAGFAKLLGENHRRLDDAASNGSDALSIWRENIIRILEYHRANPYLTSVVYRDALGRDEDFSARVDQLSRLARKNMTEELNVLKRHGLIRQCDPDIVTSIVMGSTVYVIMEHVVKGRRRNLEELADEMIVYHVQALLADGLEPTEGLNRAIARAKKKGR